MLLHHSGTRERKWISPRRPPLLMISNSAGKAEMSDADIGILIVLHEMLCYDKEVIDDDGEVHSLLGGKPPAYRVIKPRVPPHADFACGDEGIRPQLPKHGPESLTSSFRYRSIIVDLGASHCEKQDSKRGRTPLQIVTCSKSTETNDDRVLKSSSGRSHKATLVSSASHSRNSQPKKR